MCAGYAVSFDDSSKMQVTYVCEEVVCKCEDGMNEKAELCS